MRHVVVEGVDAAEVATLAPPGALVRSVTDADSAAQTVLAALRGAHVVVAVRAPRDVVDQLCDDLRHLGDVEHHIGLPASWAPRLSDDERAVLALLARGATVGEAAAQLHLSLRTTNRRLATARRALGVRTTSEAVIAAGRLGLTVQVRRAGDGPSRARGPIR